MLAEKDANLILKIENKIRQLKIETFEKIENNYMAGIKDWNIYDYVTV